MVGVAPKLLMDGVGVSALVGVLVVNYFVKPNFPPVGHGGLCIGGRMVGVSICGALWGMEIPQVLLLSLLMQLGRQKVNSMLPTLNFNMDSLIASITFFVRDSIVGSIMSC